MVAEPLTLAISFSKCCSLAKISMVAEHSAEGFDKSVAGSLGVSILVCVATGADLFPLVNMPLVVPYLGSVLTGIITARGANFVSDLFTRLNGPKKEA